MHGLKELDFGYISNIHIIDSLAIKVRTYLKIVSTEHVGQQGTAD